MILILVGCHSKNDVEKDKKDQIGIEKEKAEKKSSEKHFDFDELTHYKIEFDQRRIAELYRDRKKSEIDSLKEGIIIGSIPNKINEQNILENLELVGFKKSSINSEKFNQIENIFFKNKYYQTESAACINIYRDVIIFKQKSKIVGVAKICFECRGLNFLGTKSKSENLSQSIDYQKLQELLLNK